MTRFTSKLLIILIVLAYAGATNAGMPAARVGDWHTCPMITGLVPHVGGPILPPGVPTVLICGMPAATVGSSAQCIGPPDVIVQGSTNVLIGGMPAARVGDMSAHGGVIVDGCGSVFIGP